METIIKNKLNAIWWFKTRHLIIQVNLTFRQNYVMLLLTKFRRLKLSVHD